jgi:hypothetical protein
VAEIDLIPREYRRQRARETALRGMAGAAGALAVAGIAAAGGLAYAASRVHAQVQALELGRRYSDQQRVELANLEAEQARLQQQWSRLGALRGGGDVDALFLLIDRTLPQGELWFDRWDLRLGGEAGPAGGANAGRAAAVPAGPDAAAPGPETPRAHMKITGQARDHAALSQFVRSLYESPAVRDVHLERTGLRRYTATSVVDFELAVELEGRV